MSRINRDTLVALFLLVLTAVFWAASFDIRETSYGTISSAFWPRILLVGLGILSALYLFKSVTSPPEATDEDEQVAPGIAAWFDRYRNAMICFGLFFLYLVSMDWIGMLLGGILFVFLALTAMGEGGMRNHLIHAAVAVGTMGFMWSVFTFGIGVILPEGELFLPG